MNTATVPSAGLLVLRLVGLATPMVGGASLAIGLAGAGRFSVDAALGLPRRFSERASATS